MKEALLKDYFIDGGHVGRISDLADLAASIGFDRDEVVRAHAAATALGATATMPVPVESGGLYLRLVDRLSLELLLVPEELDGSYGFLPQELAAAGSVYAVNTEER